MEQKIKVSIIIPVYCVSAYIERCIKSIMNQTYHNIECIIVNDATLDDSIVKCMDFINEYQGPIQFLILHHDKNRGLSAARNTGTCAATGDFIFYIDSDDAITQDCIEKLVRPVFSDSGIEMVMGSFVRESDGYQITPRQQQGKILEENNYKSRDAVRDCYFKYKLYPNAWNKLIKKDFLFRNQLFFREGILWEDILWFFYVMKYLSHLYTLQDVTYIQYKRPRSITTGISQERKAYYIGLVYEDISNHFTMGEEAREVKSLLRDFCELCVQTSDNDSYHRAARQFRKVLSDGKHKSELMLLLVTVFLSKSFMGRKIYRRAFAFYSAVIFKIRSCR